MSMAATETAEVVWHSHPTVWLSIIAMAGAYIWAVSRLGPRYAPAGEQYATGRQKAFFFAGVAFVYVGAEWPIHDISENFLFSVHMIQHTLFSLVAAPLLLLGMPRWLLRLMIPRRFLPAFRLLTKPLIAFVIFNGVIVITHWPVLVNLSVRSEPGHFVLHTILFSASLLMWWPVVDPLPELSRLTEPGKMLYLFGQSILPTVPASFLTFSSTPIYSAYVEFPRLWGVSAVDDQMVAGLLMKIGGGLLLWTVIAIVFFRWYARENRQEEETVTWHDFEHELEAWDLRRT
jgi:putative membrane protein